MTRRLISRDALTAALLALLTAAGLYLCGRMALPFLTPLVWATALAVIFAPMQQRLERMLGSANRAALASVFVIGLLVVAPAAFVGQQLAVQAMVGAARVEAEAASGQWRQRLAEQPLLARPAAAIEARIDLAQTVKLLTDRFGNAAGAMARGSAVQIIGFGLVFYLLFFLLRDRTMVLAAVRRLTPLGPRDMDTMLLRIDDCIHATVYGTLAVASVQGLLGGLMFWALGLPAPLLWGVVMMVLAIVPVLGAFVVWIPAALFLVVENRWAAALVLGLWGVLVVGAIDNLLRPMLVGARLKLHTVPAFIAIVGGLLVFGSAGLILGPVILSVTLALLDVWARNGDPLPAASPHPEPPPR